MKIIRLVRTLYNPFVYKILLIKKFKKKPVVEKLGSFNKRKKKLSLNIFRLIFWLAKKNVFICPATDEIFFQTLQIFNYNLKDKNPDGSRRRLLSTIPPAPKLSWADDDIVGWSTATAVETSPMAELKKHLMKIHDYAKNKKIDWRHLAKNEKFKN